MKFSGNFYRCGCINSWKVYIHTYSSFEDIEDIHSTTKLSLEKIKVSTTCVWRETLTFNWCSIGLNWQTFFQGWLFFIKVYFLVSLKRNDILDDVFFCLLFCNTYLMETYLATCCTYLSKNHANRQINI